VPWDFSSSAFGAWAGYDQTVADPDQLLARVQEEEAKAARGKLKIFFGASAGVGKTYAMLAGRPAAERAQGTLMWSSASSKRMGARKPRR
jgi:hypothetical protein